MSPLAHGLRRIAQAVPPMERVPPEAHGGTERVVFELVTELTRRGHDITTFAICLRGEHANVLERTSRWDEAVALSTEILIKVGPSPANRLCSLIPANPGKPTMLVAADTFRAASLRSTKPAGNTRTVTVSSTPSLAALATSPPARRRAP